MLVMTPQILVVALARAFISLTDVSLLVFDEAHHCRKQHPYAQIMAAYHKLDERERPRIFGMTASPINVKLPDKESIATAMIASQIQQLEAALDAKVVTISDMAEIQLVCSSEKVDNSDHYVLQRMALRQHG